MVWGGIGLVERQKGVTAARYIDQVVHDFARYMYQNKTFLRDNMCSHGKQDASYNGTASMPYTGQL